MLQPSPLLLVVCCAALPLRAQQTPASSQQLDAAAAALRSWAADFDRERLVSTGLLRRGAGLQPAYVQKAQKAAVLGDGDLERLTHFDALQKLLFLAESHPCSDLADAVLDVAACGYDKSLVDRQAELVRDAGHWSLMRMDHQSVWFLLMRAAAGNQLQFLSGGRVAEGKDFARQVAAVKLLGQKGLPVFRAVLEGALASADARVRLAAAEAFEYQRRPEALAMLTRALGSERHPVVTQALVRALSATLRVAGNRVTPDDAARAMRTALHLLGQSGWRTDMELLKLVEQYPSRAAVPALIELLRTGGSGSDPLVSMVNEHASPLLRDKAGELLRAMTGAIIPLDQPQQWVEFWGREQERIVVPAKLKRPQDGGATAVKGFYGIPVRGREVAFLIDTSGSMSDPGGGQGEEGDLSRLDAAKLQLLLAVQSMDPQSRYHLLTFAGEAQMWSKKAVPPTPESLRSLAELLGHFRADGGTNVYAALADALALPQLRFGEQGGTDIDELFVLSDGEPTAGELKDPERILAAIRAANRYLHVRINTVYTGAGKGAGFLQQLAEQNDGVFVQR